MSVAQKGDCICKFKEPQTRKPQDPFSHVLAQIIIKCSFLTKLNDCTIVEVVIDVCSLKNLCIPMSSALDSFSGLILITNFTVESVWYSL